MYCELQEANERLSRLREEKAKLQNDVDCLIQDVASRERQERTEEDLVVQKQQRIDQLTWQVH